MELINCQTPGNREKAEELEAEKTEGYGRLPSPLSGTGYQRKPWGYSGIAEGLELNLAYLIK